MSVNVVLIILKDVNKLFLESHFDSQCLGQAEWMNVSVQQ